jgi:hypothetical protein
MPQHENRIGVCRTSGCRHGDRGVRRLRCDIGLGRAGAFFDGRPGPAGFAHGADRARESRAGGSDRRLRRTLFQPAGLPRRIGRQLLRGHPPIPAQLPRPHRGSTFGITKDCTDCLASGPNLATQLSAAGKSWCAYMGAMPRPCFAGAEVGDYAKKHNPFMYFPSVTSNPSLCARDVPETQLQPDLVHRQLPAFAWISPDLCDDAHDCGFGSADQYLRGIVPQLLGALGPDGLLVITFDEGTTNSGCCGGAAGGRVATVLLGPQVRRGARFHGAYTQYSLLATIEDRFGLARLRHARTAPALSAAFGTG